MQLISVAENSVSVVSCLSFVDACFRFRISY